MPFVCLHYIQNPSQFLSGVFVTASGSSTYIDMLCVVIQRNITETNSREIKSAASLATCLIECCHGLIDSLIPTFLTLMFDALKATKSNSASTKILEMAMALIHYNAPMLLSLLNANPTAAEALFLVLFAKLPQMEDSSTQRLVVVSFCRLVFLPNII